MHYYILISVKVYAIFILQQHSFWLGRLTVRTGIRLCLLDEARVTPRVGVAKCRLRRCCGIGILLCRNPAILLKGDASGGNVAVGEMDAMKEHVGHRQ